MLRARLQPTLLESIASFRQPQFGIPAHTYGTGETHGMVEALLATSKIIQYQFSTIRLRDNMVFEANGGQTAVFLTGANSGGVKTSYTENLQAESQLADDDHAD